MSTQVYQEYVKVRNRSHEMCAQIQFRTQILVNLDSSHQMHQQVIGNYGLSPSYILQMTTKFSCISHFAGY